ncbi:MAG TPA: tetratricopeptide repeat protein [Gemmataceae bacterium]|nr:tetratricopeptide repeat protein [Gemmataceae bacterium]
MSETNSLLPLEKTTDESRPADTATTNLEASGHALFERLGVGGMGEVYRCGDDALQRDLAVKILKPELRGDADAEQRFLREARLTGSLQHPGIVPVHHLGQLADGRPCYTMKLVRGRTFADMLRDEPEGPERLPRLLAAIEKVCQAVAFAHSKGVIHRDLKPSNVMVGEFGEVQVMDWGLAKELSRSEPAPPPEATESVETAAWTKEGEGLSRAGLALGTPAYMPPEQAAGDWDIVDERADVFALGAILCEMLTGRPPYHGANRDDLLRRARRGDMAEALGRLAKCGADAVLVDLCRECLAAERLQRPRHAGVVAERLAAYQAEVRERLRQAELQRARAEVKALEERKRRRLLAALALLVLLVVLGAGGGVWWQQQQRARADQAVSNALAQANLLAEQARADPLQTDKYHQALELARGAVQLAQTASADARQKAEQLVARLQQDEEAARKDRELLAALLDVRGPHEGPRFQSDARNALTAMAEPTADEQFAAAFRRWGLDVDGASPAEAAALLKARPPMVLTELSAALDEWASERRRQGKAKEDWQRLLELAALLDDNLGSKRREMQQILARGRLPLERALDVLSAALRPVPVPVEVALGPDRTRLRQLAEETNAAREPILGLLTLVRALGAVGEEARAERLLRAAIVARPREVVLHHTLGQLLTSGESPRWAEAVECYGAARSLRPDLGVNLATALRNSGRVDEGLSVLARLVSEAPTNPILHHRLAWALHTKRRLDEAVAEYRQAVALAPKEAKPHIGLGIALYDKRRLDEAVAEYRQAIALDPKEALAHYNLGIALRDKGRLDETVAEYRQAIALDPKYSWAHNNLGAALSAKGRLDEAVAEYRQAIALDPKNAKAHYNLGADLHTKGRLDEAVAEFHKALALDPKDFMAHNRLGGALRDKGRLDEAVAEYRQAIALDPKNAKAHYNLGGALRAKGQLDEAVAEYHRAIQLKPDFAEAYCNLGQVLQQQGRFDEALASRRRGHELGLKRPGWRYPSAQWVRDAERLLVLDNKLPAILSGNEAPANPGEAVALASMCQQPYKKRLAAAARLYADAFAAEPKLTADLNRRYRYNAACAAALAAAGQGKDARQLPDKSVAMFRRWALVWLRDDLTAYIKLAEKSNPTANKAIPQRVAHWRSDPDLASVRDPQALDRLPENERAAWQALWRDVDELAKRAAKKDAVKK